MNLWLFATPEDAFNTQGICGVRSLYQGTIIALFHFNTGPGGPIPGEIIL
jgi:hypothetical protein